ncbi:MAG TPA: WD40 repeat domain-containing protein [Pirellulaceae bacterium]|nr:WD40 repeat domain-containing protein [Pirellulaceae bacterium]
MIQRREFLGATAAMCVLGTRNGWASTNRSDWSCETLQTVACAPGLYAPVVTGVALQPGGNQLATVGDDHCVSIFELPSARLVTSLARHRDWVRTARYSPDGKTLATAGNDRQILLWDTSTWSAPALLAAHKQAIADVSFAPHGRVLAAVGFDAMLRVYDVAKRQLINHYELPCSDMHALCFADEGATVVSGGRSGVIRAVDWASGRLLWDVAAHAKRVRCLSVNSQGLIVSCGEDQKVRVFRQDDPEQVILEKRLSSKQFAAIWIDHQTMATAGADNQVSIWDIAHKQTTSLLQGHTGTVSCLDFQGGTLVSGSFDTQVRIWRRQTQVQLDLRQLDQAAGWSQQLR